MTPVGYSGKVKALLTIILAYPFLAGLFSGKTSLPFPPLGDDLLTYKVFAVVIAGAATFLPFYLPKGAKHGLYAAMCFVLLLLSVGTYVMFVQPAFVLGFPRPEGKHVYVVRGSDRNPALREPLRSASNEDAILAKGQSDDALATVYTRWSLARNRMIVFGSYELCLVTLALFVGLLADTPAK